LIEFKVRRENFDQNSVEIHQLFSRSMTDALDFAVNELEGDGWYIISITRICDDIFFASLPDNSSTNGSDVSVTETFVAIMRELFGNDSTDSTVE